MGTGYRNIHLYTEDERLAALNIYLNLGYVPLMTAPDMEDRWQVICSTLDWPYNPITPPRPTLAAEATGKN